jgi:hypothetical protein
LGVVPSVNSLTAYKYLELGSAPGSGIYAGGYETYINNNCYYNGGFKYANTAAPAALQYAQSGGKHTWYTAPSGTAGTAITFTQSLALGKGTSLALEGATSAAGTGIAFPATQLASTDPNTLDDYEEGTWTPNQGAGLTVVGAFSSSATYTKIGRQVTVNGVINGVTSVAVTSGGTLTSNLPFTALAPGGAGSSVNAAVTASGVCFATGTSVLSATAIAATPSIYFSVTYFV